MSNDFKDLIGQVKSVKADTSPNFYKENTPKKNRQKLSEEFEFSTISQNGFDIDSEDILEFRRDGVQKTVFKKLEKGEMSLYDSIDLHGMNLLEAEMYVSDAIDNIQLQHMTCIRIVHGKGYNSNEGNLPKLKNFIARYLMENTRVLAYASCPVSHGGAGAVYVLLSKSG